MRTPHPSNYTRPQLQLRHAAQLLTEAAVTIADIWPRICDGINGQPSAQATDSDGGSSSVLDDHGVPMPRLSDPTGEANTRRDPARRDLDELRKIIQRLHRDAERVIAIFASHEARPANGYERIHTANDDPGCRSCARLDVAGAPRWEPVHATPTIAEDKTPLCRWCYDWLRSTGELPPRRLLTDHHDGKRIRRPA